MGSTSKQQEMYVFVRASLSARERERDKVSERELVRASTEFSRT